MAPYGAVWLHTTPYDSARDYDYRLDFLMTDALTPLIVILLRTTSERLMNRRGAERLSRVESPHDGAHQDFLLVSIGDTLIGRSL